MPLPPRFSSVRYLVVLAMLLALGIGALFARAIWTIREDDWSAAQSTNTNLVRTLEQSVARTLDGFDQSILGVARGLATPAVMALEPGLRSRVLFDNSLRVLGVQEVLVSDAAGRVVLALEPELDAPHGSVAGRDYFLAHLASTPQGLFIGQPWRSRSSDGHLLPLSRAYYDAQGRFAGVVVVALRLDYLGELLGALELSPRSTANLFHTNGTLLARFPYHPKDVGRNLSGTPTMRGLLSSSSGVFTGVAAIDAVQRLYVFRHVSQYPLVINVAESTDTILARWRSNAWLLGSFAALLMAACLALAGLFRRALRQGQRLGAQLQQAEHDLRTILNNLPSMVSYWDSGLRNRFANQPYLDWFGVSAEQIKSMALRDLLGEAAYAQSLPYVEQALLGRRQRFERTMTDAGGAVHFNTAVYVPDLEEGQVRGVFVQLIDITERKRMEHELFEEKERMRLTLASIGDAVLCTDAQARVTYLNPVAERMTGWQAFDAAGRHIDEVAPLQVQGSPAAVPSPLCQALAQVRSLGPTRGVVLLRGDSQRFDVEESASPITDLRGQVSGGVMVLHDITESVAMAARMAHLAQYDALTDLPNRVLLQDRARQGLASARRQGRSLAVVYLDLDGFKQVNDLRGHDAGDQLLVEFAQRLRAAVRASDTVSRQGGDEFIALLDGPADAAHVALVARKMLAICQSPFELDAGTECVGVSGGIALYPQHGQNFEELSRHADAALYAAKRSGRGRFCLYTSAQGAPVCVAAQDSAVVQEAAP